MVRKQATIGVQCCSANLNSLSYAAEVLVSSAFILCYTWRAFLLAFPYS